jgi:hypothetical protein
MYSKTLVITPKQANEILKNNPINRRISLTAVNYYATQMKKGKWFSETDESIKVAANGTLIDGQHRLHAIVKSDTPTLMKITYDMPIDAFKFIDQGKKRSAQDALHVSGVKNSGMICGIIKSYQIFKSGGTNAERSQQNASLSNDDIHTLYFERPDYWQDIFCKTQRWYKLFHKLINPSFIGSHYALLSDLHVEQADSFFEKLCSGVGVTSHTDPIKLLRDYFLRQIDLKGKKVNTYSYNSAMTLKAWNLYRKNKTAGVLKIDMVREGFPKPI